MWNLDRIYMITGFYVYKPYPVDPVDPVKKYFLIYRWKEGE